MKEALNLIGYGIAVLAFIAAGASIFRTHKENKRLLRDMEDAMRMNRVYNHEASGPPANHNKKENGP